MGRLSRPLNKEAIKKADIEFYQGHPEQLKNGKPSPLSVNDPDQAQLCNEWQQLYQKHGGEIETADEQFAAKKPDDPVQPCPLQPKNWIDLEYLYADGQGISGARYQVFDSTTDALLTASVLNGKGKAHADLPLEVNQVKVRYFNDPTEVETIHESQPQVFLEPSGWYERMTDNIKSSGSWTWGVIQGDFNENPTMAQIATNAVITAIPVVDQVADVRDIVAIVKQMVWEKRNDIATWFALFITVIGLIPTVGSLLKGVLKAIWHGAKLSEILKIFNYFKKSNGVKWLKELRAGKLKCYAQQTADNAHKLFDALSEKLTQLKAHVPKAMSDTHKALDDTLSRLGEIKGQINSKFAEIAESLKQKLGRSLDEADDELSLSNTQTRYTRKQEIKDHMGDNYNGPKIPDYHVGNFTNKLITNRQVSGEETFYKYHGPDNRLGKTHNYVTKELYSIESALRDDLAILDEWGISFTHVTTFKPVKGTWIGEGTAAKQVGDFSDEIRLGGGY